MMNGEPPEAFFHFDCCHFRGDKPCVYKRGCRDCPHYDPRGARILIIKLGAMGDVIRTTPLLRGLRSSQPGCQITWVTRSNVIPLLDKTGYIDRILEYNWQNCSSLSMERFDQALCLDKERDVTAFMNTIQATSKYGFALGEYGQIIPAGPSSEYLFHLGVSDELKFRLNQQSYPELIFDCMGIPFSEEEYVLPDLSEEAAWAARRLHSMGVEDQSLKVGFNTGSGMVFATKKWTNKGFIALGKRLAKERNASILLLGSEAERERNAQICQGIGQGSWNTGSENSLREFSGLISQCDLVVTSDTLGMHIAIGLNRRVVALFGPTCQQEIDLFGRGVKVVTDFECSPCYLQTCPYEVTCMDDMSHDRVYDACLEALSLRVKVGVTESVADNS